MEGRQTPIQLILQLDTLALAWGKFNLGRQMKSWLNGLSVENAPLCEAAGRQERQMKGCGGAITGLYGQRGTAGGPREVGFTSTDTFSHM